MVPHPNFWLLSNKCANLLHCGTLKGVWWNATQKPHGQRLSSFFTGTVTPTPMPEESREVLFFYLDCDTQFFFRELVSVLKFEFACGAKKSKKATLQSLLPSYRCHRTRCLLVFGFLLVVIFFICSPVSFIRLVKFPILIWFQISFGFGLVHLSFGWILNLFEYFFLPLKRTVPTGLTSATES